ncbi:hypothetical protein O7599_32440 [Streptomyces sp. WMMC500]|uniref:hypothetical protein n=1 Tax=Streptomyces sp. WMMC500 TaxID=3015154 RepID=UPI00248D0ABE|nr:hypothetical protein [Streptomyces sp. WMMC500]WBB64729.1 hypothetical protein O7599_32440 [Streptomyces sp. WMMC500]
MALRWGSWAALAAGAVLCAVGWYGVSGERFAERQIPYLASCTIPGAALIVAGAVLLSRGDQGLAAARVEELYGLLVAADRDGDADGSHAEASPGPAPGPESGGAAPYLAVPGGTLYHRPGCPLVGGKPGAVPVADPAEAAGAERELTPCPVCEPGPAPGAAPEA